jgi:cold shock CspA family protein
MHQKIEESSGEYIKNLFVPEKIWDKFPSFISPVETDSVDNSLQSSPYSEFDSIIFSINPNGFGFIKDEERNNIFFHYSTVTNRDFSELKSGMQVGYMVEEDEERSKRDEVLRFRARKVTVLDDE